MLKPAVPMNSNPTLLEPSFVDAMIAIRKADDLSDQHRRHWSCSLKQIGKWLDRPLSLIPARWTSVRMPVGQLHHARVGVTAKTMANHKSNVRVALRWFSKEHDVPLRGVPLSPKWLTLRDSIKDGGQLHCAGLERRRDLHLRLAEGAAQRARS